MLFRSVQLVVFIVWPPVHTVVDVFGLMNENPVLGLLSMDVLLLSASTRRATCRRGATNWPRSSTAWCLTPCAPPESVRCWLGQ